jgi:transglutaminase-like putative cysteine protease
MRVRIQHTTRLDYNADVAEGVTDARLGPRSDAHQRWGRFVLRIDPPAAVRRYTDGFQNEAHLITVGRAHRSLQIVAEGEVFTGLADPFRLPARAPAPLPPGDLVDYCSPSALVQWDESVTAVAAPFAPRDPSGTFEAVQGLMDEVYTTFVYKPDVTTVSTTVLDVMDHKSGVCQDFAHVLLALCRSIGIPARYVSGYTVSRGNSRRQGQSQTQRGGPGPGRSRSQSQAQSQSQSASPPGAADVPRRGQGASHAWIEAFTPTHGWRGFDPTNNLVASEHHVKIAVGRDYRDVPPTRGTFRGEAEETLSVHVEAAPLA